MAHRQAKAGPFAGRFGGEERIEFLFPPLGRDARAVVADMSFRPVAEASCRRAEHRFKGLVCFGLVLGGSVEAVGDQIEQCPGNLLRIYFCRTRVRVEVAIEGDAETGLFRPRAVIGEIEAFLDQGVDVSGSVLAASLARGSARARAVRCPPKIGPNGRCPASPATRPSAPIV